MSRVGVVDHRRRLLVTALALVLALVLVLVLVLALVLTGLLMRD